MPETKPNVNSIMLVVFVRAHVPGQPAAYEQNESKEENFHESESHEMGHLSNLVKVLCKQNRTSPPTART